MIVANFHPERGTSGLLQVVINEMPLGAGGPLFCTVHIFFEDETNKAVFYPDMSVEELLVIFPNAIVHRDGNN